MQSEHRPVLSFVILVFALSIPFWILGSVFDVQLLPGLPIGSLAVFTPGAAAAVMVYRTGRSPAVGRLLRRSFDVNRIRDRKWYFFFVLFNPVVAILSFQILRAMGVAVPNPAPLTFAVVPLCAFAFITALGEEIGWTGYATGIFVHRWGIPLGGLSLGLIWAAFHIILLTQVDRSLEWIVWWALGTLSLRTIMAWLYEHAGDSVFAAAIFHTMINVSWQLFPINGSFYDPQVFSLVTLALGVFLVIAWRRVSRAK
jgi:membrane protease YdiL (CAAX protease family)